MSNKQAVKKLLGLLTGYKKTIAFIMACLLVSTGLNLCIPILSKHIMDDGFIGRDIRLLIALVLLSTLFYGINCVIDIIKEKKRVDISAGIQFRLAEQSFTHLMKLKIDYFNHTNHAEILNHINMDITNMTSVADEAVFFVVTQAFGMIGGMIGLFIIDYRLAILVLLFIPMKYAAMKYFAQKRKGVMDEYITKSQDYAGWFGDTAGGVREIKLFGIFGRKHKEFEQKQNGVIGEQKKLNLLSQWNMTADTMMVQLLTAVLYITGAILVFRMELSVGSVFAFITYSSYVTGPISAILNIGYLLSGILPSTKRYYAFMELSEEETLTGSEPEKEPKFGALALEEVCFCYGTEKNVLKQLNLVFPEKSKTALIGRNGSGKTTLIHLLTGMYRPSQGRVLLNGTDIREFSLRSYRDMVSIVSQQIYLFNDTIRNNICLYKEVDDETVRQACEDSSLKEFLDGVSLDYVVGENGTMLSGGQKQKIALARALIHDRPILIFDEATSNTDVYSESQINCLLHTRLKDKTVIVVTHKKDILNEVEQIILLEDGRVCGQGVYQELYRNNERFREMADLGN